MSTRTTIEELLRRIGGGDGEHIADAYADEVDWQLDWPADEHGTNVPWIRHRTTRADVADHFRTIASNHRPEDAGVQISRILVDGPDAMVMGTITNVVKRTNKGYRAHFALHLTVEDGLVTRHHVYEDSLSVARAWSNNEDAVNRRSSELQSEPPGPG